MQAKYDILRAVVDEVVAPRLARIHVASLVAGQSVTLGGLVVGPHGIGGEETRARDRLTWDALSGARIEKSKVAIYEAGQRSAAIKVPTREIDAVLLPHVLAGYQRHQHPSP